MNSSKFLRENGYLLKIQLHLINQITIFSTVFVELNNFRKPLIFVNRFDHYAWRIVKKKISIENQVYDKEIKEQIYEFKNFFLEEIKKKITENIYKNEFVKSVPELLHKKHK